MDGKRVLVAPPLHLRIEAWAAVKEQDRRLGRLPIHGGLCRLNRTEIGNASIRESSQLELVSRMRLQEDPA